MSGAVWGGTVLAFAAWVLATRTLMAGSSTGGAERLSGTRRLLVLAVCLGAGVGGCWGPTVHRSTETDLATGVSGSPAEEVTRQIRTPVGVISRTMEFGHTGERIREVRTRSYHLPLTLLGLLLWAGWGRVRAGQGGGPGWTRATALSLLLPLSGCDDGSASLEREGRTVLEVAWDTLLVVESHPEDTLLFDIRRLQADAFGIRVLDGVGYRVALLDWDGRLRWYAGRRGRGPGELSNPRALALDRQGRVWVLDVETHRITGFDREGFRVEEVSLSGLDFVPHQFAVDGEGERFFFARADGGIRPVEVRRDGTVRTGSRVRFPGSREAPGLALQGEVRSEPEGARWIAALAMGDGLLRFDGLAPTGPFRPWVEEVPLARVEVTTEGSPRSGEFSRTQRIVDPVFAAQGASVADSRILILFGGRTEHRNRLLDIYDLEDGGYRGSLLLPAGGLLAAWGDRIVLGRNAPHPRILVLRPREWP